MRFPATLALLLASPLALAAELEVYPSQPGNLQDVIDVAQPGDVLRIYPGHYSPVVIDKPLTLIAHTSADRPRILAYDPNSFPPTSFDPAITLAGPGAGAVTLHGLVVDDIYSYGWFLPGEPDPALTGGGFESVTIVGCELRGPRNITSEGSSPGTAAIAVDLPLLTVVDSTVAASDNETDILTYATYPARPAIDAPSATVVALDSAITGGAHWPLSAGGFCDDPTYIPSGPTGAPAVRAARLFEAGGAIQGGPGPDYYGCSVTPIPGPAGPTFEGALEVPLDDRLDGSGSPKLGSLFQLAVDLPDPGLVLIGTELAHPVDAGALGWLFLDVGAPTLTAVAVPAGPTTLDWVVPFDPSLLAVDLAFQAIGVGSGLTRPDLLEVTLF